MGTPFFISRLAIFPCALCEQKNEVTEEVPIFFKKSKTGPHPQALQLNFTEKGPYGAFESKIPLMQRQNKGEIVLRLQIFIAVLLFFRDIRVFSVNPTMISSKSTALSKKQPFTKPNGHRKQAAFSPNPTAIVSPTAIAVNLSPMDPLSLLSPQTIAKTLQKW